MMTTITLSTSYQTLSASAVARRDLMFTIFVTATTFIYFSWGIFGNTS